MKIFINLAVAILLSVGIFWQDFATVFSLSSATALALALVAIFAISVLAGSWWFFALKNSFPEKPDISNVHVATDVILRDKIRWLQGARPIAAASRIVTANSFDLFMVAIQKRFFSSYLLGISLLGLGSFVFLAFKDASASHGIFGALLHLPMGKGVAIAFSIYLSISSLAFLVVGFLAHISKGSSK